MATVASSSPPQQRPRLLSFAGEASDLPSPVLRRGCSGHRNCGRGYRRRDLEAIPFLADLGGKCPQNASNHECRSLWRLGLARGCSYDQVPTAYEKKCEELRNQELDEEEVSKQLELLKESYEILSSEEEIRIYDWSLSRSEKPDKYMRPFEVDLTRTPTEPPPPQEPEDVGPTRLYFLLLSVHDLQQMSLLPFSM